jgi:glycosyltransferase involved in cell wall biosynthesis
VHIALLTHEPFYPPSGGGSAAAVYLVRELVRRAHQVEVFAPGVGDLQDIEERFAIRYRPFTRWRMGRTTSLRTAKYLAYPSALTRWMSEVIQSGAHYDVLLSQHSISAVAAGRLRRQFRIPAVFNLLDCLTGFMETWPPYLMPRAMARALVRYELSLPRRYQVEGVLSVSDALRDRLIAQRYPAERVRAIYYGYDPKLFRPRQRGSPDEAMTTSPLVVMHGSFDHHHLGPIARDALLAVARARPEVRFRFVGPRTSALQHFLKTVRRAAPGIAAEETGFVRYDQIPAVLSEATLGITPYQPSTGTHCAFVAKTVEYLALGLPVVSTPLESALRYYAGCEAVKFSDDTAESFARAMLEWLAMTRVARAAAVEPARLKVEAQLNWDAVCGRAAEFIELTAGARDAA